MNDEGQPGLPLTRSRRAEAAPRNVPGPNSKVPALLRIGPFEALWRTLGLSDTERGRPLRLLAAPEDVLAPEVVRGKAIRAGHFRFRGIELELEKLDQTKTPLPQDYDAYLDGFGWARDLAAAAPLNEMRPLAERIVERWLHARPGGKKDGVAWAGEVTGWRIMNTAAAAPLLLASKDGRYRAKLLDHLAECEAHLWRSGDKARRGRAQIVAAAGGVAAALLLSRTKKTRAWHEKRMKRAIENGIYADGGIASRAPLGLFSLAEALALLAACYRARQQKLPDFLDDAQRRVLGAMRSLLHGDGGTASWQGAAPIPATRLDTLIAASRVVPRARADVRHWGYQRLTAGKATLLMDAAPPPGAGQSEAGCASTLGIEFSAGAERIVTSCGGAALVGANIPAALAKGLRSTAAHSTLCLDNVNSTSVLPRGALGDGVDTVDCDVRDTGQGIKIEAGHDGYDRNFGFMHRRAVILSEDGRKLRGTDTLLPGKRVQKGRTLGFAIRFHLHPDIEVETRADGQSALLRLASGSLWHFHATDGLLTIEESLIVDSRGRPQNSWQIVLSGETGAGGMSSGWLINQMS